ncbi:MAG: YHS domain-containing (seleno)protein [Bacteroidota bacterium]
MREQSNRLRRAFLSLLFISVFASVSISQSLNQRVKHYNIKSELAIQGYDPAAYFSNEAVKGRQEYALTYRGLAYHFSSAANRETFQVNPTQFEPQYGGWCAFAMGDYGKKVKINPKTFKIIEGRLYLFYNAYFNNTLESWNEDEAALKAKADQNWKTIINY